MVTQAASALASSLPASLIGIVLDYFRSPVIGMGYRCDRLVYPGSDLDIQATERAFAVRMSDGSVECWGDPLYGGDCSLVRAGLKNVKAICVAWFGAFAAIVGDDNNFLSYFQKPSLKRDGTVVTWGHKGYGGVIPPSVKERLKQVQCISGNYGVFAALLSDGTVEAWGNEGRGGDSSIVDGLVQVDRIYANYGAFAALRKDGTVVTWGNPGYGGDSSPVRSELKKVVAIGSAGYVFAAVRSDGSVVTWGMQILADSSSVAGELREVVAIRGAYKALAALRRDGTVVTWGDENPFFRLGGNSLGVQSELKQVVSLTPTGYAFAALRSDGKVVTWGEEEEGGDNSSVPPALAVPKGKAQQKGKGCKLC